MKALNVPELVEELLDEYQFLRYMKVAVYGSAGKVILAVETDEGDTIFTHDTGMTPADSLAEVFDTAERLTTALRECGTDAAAKKGGS